MTQARQSVPDNNVRVRVLGKHEPGCDPVREKSGVLCLPAIRPSDRFVLVHHDGDAGSIFVERERVRYFTRKEAREYRRLWGVEPPDDWKAVDPQEWLAIERAALV